MKQYSFNRFEGEYQRGDNKIAINRFGLIAFKLIASQEKGALRLTKDKSSLTISAKLFFLANNLEEKKCLGRYDWERLSLPYIGEVYIIELNKK